MINTPTSRMTRPSESSQDFAKLLLRLLLAVLLLFHGVSKIQNGPGALLEIVTNAGLPAAFAYLAYVGEVAAPLLLIFGLWTRVAAAIIAINMLFAFALVHSAQLFTLAKSGGWALELQGFYLGTALVIMLLGAGRYSLGGISGRWN